MTFLGGFMLKKLFIVLLLSSISQVAGAGIVKSCNAEQSKCYIEPLKAEAGDIVLVFSKSGNHIIAKAKVIRSSKTFTEIEVLKKKDDQNISSGFTAIKMRVDSHDIWTTTTSNI